jgi:hypothetical protein
MWPSDRSIAEGDVLMFDTGSRLGGYFCDFNRNFAVVVMGVQCRYAKPCYLLLPEMSVAKTALVHDHLGICGALPAPP